MNILEFNRCSEKMNKMELLAPAGSMEAFRAAVLCGADAVYAGLGKFGARAYAENFTTETFLEAMEFAHLHEKRVYLTVNTLFKQSELDSNFYQMIAPLYERGLDGVIVQDLGVFSFLQEAFPDLALHASTQMTVTSSSAANWLKERGATRIVPARELSLNELSQIKKDTGLEIEVFVHGALCYSYSGQCLFSSMLGGRSGNRGKCAQPCRLLYNAGSICAHLLSMKDLNGLAMLPALKRAGVDSLKIEGRMKSPEYTAATVSIYRMYLDQLYISGEQSYQVDPKDLQTLAEIYNRGGFTEGYFYQKNSPHMISPYRPNHYGYQIGNAVKTNNSLTVTLEQPVHAKDVLEIRDRKENTLLRFTARESKTIGETISLPSKKSGSGAVFRVHSEALLDEWRKQIRTNAKRIKRPITGKVYAKLEEPLSLTVRDSATGYEQTVSAGTPEPAISQPLSEQQLREAIQKTGDTVFSFTCLDVVCGEHLFIPRQTLNTLRRNALCALQNRILAVRRTPAHSPRVSPETTPTRYSTPNWSVLATLYEQLTEVLSYPQVKRIYVEYNLYCTYRQQILHLSKEHKIEWFLAMPHVFRQQELAAMQSDLSDINRQFCGILVRNLDSYAWARAHCGSLAIICDSSLYAWNLRAAGVLRSNTFTCPPKADPSVSLTAPLELNQSELLQHPIYEEYIAYGRTALMVAANCLAKTSAVLANKNTAVSGASICKKTQNVLYLTDRYRKRFPVVRYCFSCYNVIFNADPLCLFDQMPALKQLNPEFLRLSFTDENAGQCRQILALFLDQRTTGGKQTSAADLSAALPDGFTRGHFKRGVE